MASISARHGLERSPGLRKSTWRDVRQKGQWFRCRPPETVGPTKARQRPHLNGSRSLRRVRGRNRISRRGLPGRAARIIRGSGRSSSFIRRASSSGAKRGTWVPPIGAERWAAWIERDTIAVFTKLPPGVQRTARDGLAPRSAPARRRGWSVWKADSGATRTRSTDPDALRHAGTAHPSAAPTRPGQLSLKSELSTGRGQPTGQFTWYVPRTGQTQRERGR